MRSHAVRPSGQAKRRRDTTRSGDGDQFRIRIHGDTCSQVGLAIDIIQYFAGVMPHDQAIDCEVPPLHILFRGARILHPIRMPSVAVANVRPKRRHLHLASVALNQNHAKLRTNRYAIRKKFEHLLGSRAGGHIVIRGRASEQQVAHAPACQKRLESCVL